MQSIGTRWVLLQAEMADLLRWACCRRWTGHRPVSQSQSMLLCSLRQKLLDALQDNTCEPSLSHQLLQWLHLSGMVIILNRLHTEDALGNRKHPMHGLCPASLTCSLSNQVGLHLGLVVPPVDEQRHAGAATKRVQHPMAQAAVKHQEAVLAGVGQQAALRRLSSSPGGAVLLIHHHCGSWQPERAKAVSAALVPA